jgi:hypothetical protein
VNSTGLGDVARHCFSPPARRPPGAKTTFKDVDGPFHETAFVGDTHTHTHMHGTHARSRHIDRALPRFHAKETISNAEVATYTLHSSRLDSRYNSSPLFNKNQKKSTGRLLLGGPPTNRGFHRICIITRFFSRTGRVLSRPGASILSFRRTLLRPSRSSRIDRRATAPCKQNTTSV